MTRRNAKPWLATYQETHGPAGTCAASQKRSGIVMNAQ
jgi:hypothetical protein